MKRIVLTSLLLALCFTQSAHAAIAMLNAAETASPTACGGAGTCDLAAMTLSAGSNRKAICSVSAEDNATNYNVNGVTFGGVAMSPAVQAESPTDQNIVELYYLNEASLPAPGDHTVAVDFTEDVTIVSITCWTVQGIASGAPKSTDKVESDVLGSATLTLTGIVATDWIFTAATESGGAATNWTHGASQTEISEVDFGSATTAISRAAGITDPSSNCGGACGAPRFAMVGAAWAEFSAASTFVPMGNQAQQID